MLAFGFAGLLLFSVYGLAAPASARCALPGRIACAGGLLGPPAPRQSGGDQWFNVVLYDYGFWVTNTVSGANESTNWTLFEGYTIHVNTTSANPDPSVGGTGAHGLGLTWSGGGPNFAQIAPVGSWVSGSFAAPTSPVQGGTVYCSNYCGSGHPYMVVYILNILPATSPPAVTISANPVNGLAPLAVHFASTVQAGTSPYVYRWSFGDGTSSAFVNPAHTYALAGNYSASLLVIDRNGLATRSSTVAIVARATPPYGVVASGTPSTGAAPLNVAFTSEAYGGLPPYAYSWAFGDGALGVGATTSHTYSAGGSYIAVVTAVDGRGVPTGASVPVSVSSATQGPLTVHIAVVPAFGDLPLSINASASVSGGSGTPGPVSWDFGDGSPRVQGSETSHTYTDVDPGVLSLLAIVRTDRGELATSAVPIQLFARPSGQLAEALPHPWAPANVTLSVALTGGNGTFGPIAWDFGDGSTAVAGTTVRHAYTAPGEFRISVTTSDSTGRPILATGWVNLTANRSIGPTGPTAVHASANAAPLAFVGVVGGTGLLLVIGGAIRDRRRESEPPWEDEP